MTNIRICKDSNTYNESLDYEKSTGDNNQSFELGTMFTTQDHRIINTNKTSTREMKLQNKTTDNKSK